MTDVPSNLVPTRISQLTEYDGLSQDGYLPYVLNGVTYKVRFGNIASVGAVPSTRTITGGSGLAGGGDLSADRVIYLADGGVTFSKLADSGVVAGVYGSATEIPVLTVDQKGRVTVATTTPINLTNYVQTSRSILAGAGLTGGGTLAADRTLSIDFSNATPQPLGIPTAGTGTQAAREDHVHPAVDLSDTTETTGALPLSRGGTGSSLSPVAGAVLYSDGSNIDLSNPGTTGQFLISQGTGAPDWVDLTGGTTGFTFTIVGGDCVLGGTLGVANGGTGAVTAAGARVNLLPSYVGNASKVLAVNALETDVEWVTGGGGGGSGTVTSVAMTVPTGLQVSGSPITTSGTLAVTLQSGYSIPTTASQANWDTAYADRLKWDGGATGLVAATGRTSLGATTVGSNFFTLTNPSAITFPRINADNSVSALTATNFRTAIGAGTGDGTVTSVSGTGSVNGITLTGTVTSSGSLTLGGTLSNVSLTTQVTGTLPVGNGGTGQTTYTDGQLLIGNSTGNTLTKATLTAGSGISITNGAGSITIAATGGGGSGTVTSVDVSGGTTGLTFSGGPITTSGTITMAGTLDADNGGTGISSYTVGDILYASTTTTLAKLADVATGNALISGGVGVAPSWGKIGLTTHVSGTLPVGNGGTGVTGTPTNGQLLIGNGTGFSLATLTAGTNITITNSAGGITIDAAGGGGSLLGQTDSASPFETSLGYQAGNVNTGDGNTFLGYQSGLVHTSGLSNTAVGYFSLKASTTGNYNVAMGSQALLGLTTGQQNSAVGYRALQALTTGNNNVAFGVEALLKITSNGQNTAVGTQALTNLSGGSYQYNTGIGYGALRSQTTSSNNTGLGMFAGSGVTTGANNTLVGCFAGSNPTFTPTTDLTTGSNNIIIGYGALPSAATVSNEITLGDANITSLRIPGLQAGKTTGDVLTFDGSKIVLQTPGGGGGLLGDTDNATPFETSLGFNAGNANTGVNNTFVGYQAGLLNSTGTDNAVLGYNALDANTTGSRNSAFGSNALGANISGNDNTAFGYNALLANTASGNTAFGSGALDANTTGTLNTAFGRDALGAVTTASENTAIGNQALLVNTTGSNNTVVGSSALKANTSGASNTAVGASALNSNVNAGSCVAVGAYALLSQTGGSGSNTAVGTSSSRLLTTGNENITVGAGAGYGITTGSRNVLIGYNAGANTINFTTGANNIVIGHGADPSSATVSNEITLGNSSITAFRIPGLSVSWTANTVPFRNVPAVGTQTASYTLAVADVGKYVELSTGSDAVVPNSTFANGDIVSLFNNTSGNITITLNTTDAYIAGNNTNKGGGGTMTLATRGVASILFISGTLCVVSGNVS